MVSFKKTTTASEKNTHESPLKVETYSDSENNHNGNLDHFLQEVIDLVFSISKVSTLNKVVGLLSPSSGWVVELEWPQEVGGILEVGSNRQDLVDQVLNTDDAHLAKLGLNDLIRGDWGAVSINLR